MTNPLSRIAMRVAYGASQLPRVAWYVGHGLAMRRLAKAARWGRSAARPYQCASARSQTPLPAARPSLSPPTRSTCSKRIAGRRCPLRHRVGRERWPLYGFHFTGLIASGVSLVELTQPGAVSLHR
jgi:hypothetical protein